MLIFLEITVVVVFVMSLAAIVVISSLGARKRNRALENANALYLIGSASDYHVD